MTQRPQEPGKALDRAILTILTGARKLIAKPEHWTKCAGARDRDGEACDTDDEAAVCFCPTGAIYRAAGFKEAPDAETPPQVLHATARVAARLAGEKEPAPWDYLDGPNMLLNINDLSKTTHDEVLAAFDGAITLTKERLS